MARTVGMRGAAFSGGLRQVVQDQRALGGAGAEEHVVDLGGVLRLHRHVRGHAQLGVGRRAGRRGGGCGHGDLAGERNPAAFMCGNQPELLENRDGRRRIDRELGLDGRAGRIVDLVDQPRCKLGELALLVVAVDAGLHIEVGQHAQQRRPNIDAFATGERHQPVESGKQRLGHGEIRDLEEILPASLSQAPLKAR
ncbi:hypothetical protein ABIG07_005401 [Bradyrhizobium ottawaense]|uniref:Uncharacterized protein n=1 Tax=Bradyrhizobium ottawaense TaxID=931866 RepID=A0ABV4G010_9BRAD